MQAFLDIGELLISNDPAAALEAFKTVRASNISIYLCIFAQLT